MCNIGTCLWILNDLEAADAMFRRVLEQDPDNAIAKSSLRHVRRVMMMFAAHVTRMMTFLYAFIGIGTGRWADEPESKKA